MKRLLTYLRQTFTEDISVTLLPGGLILTVFCWTIGIFYWGIDLLLLPIMLGIIFLMLAGPIILIVYLKRKNKDGGLKAKNLGRLKSFAFGTYIGFVLINPIHNWDEKQRQKSGLIISDALEIYKNENGHYPSGLSLIKHNLDQLPSTYSWDKFNYRLDYNKDYHLDIPVPIMDRWHWDKEKKIFVYNNF